MTHANRGNPFAFVYNVFYNVVPGGFLLIQNVNSLSVLTVSASRQVTVKRQEKFRQLITSLSSFEVPQNRYAILFPYI